MQVSLFIEEYINAWKRAEKAKIRQNEKIIKLIFALLFFIKINMLISRYSTKDIIDINE